MNNGTQSAVNERTQKSRKTTLRMTTTAAQTIGKTRNEMIAEAAYFLAEQRGFADGCALEDWLQAEAGIDAMLAKWTRAADGAK